MDALLASFTSFGHEEAHDRYRQVYHTEEIQPHHKASFTHEAIAGAAGFAAMKAYESHLRATGQQPSHPLMKELLAGIAAAEVDKLIETKGLDWLDRQKAHRLAERQAHDLAMERYQGGTGWEYAQAQGGYTEAYSYGGGMPWGAPGHGGYVQQQGYGGEGYGGYPGQGGYGGGGYGGYAPQPQGYAQQGGYYQGQPAYGGYQEGYEHEHERHHHHHHHHG